ncbi:MAG: hypothetical protein ACR2HX_17095, partial [Pyrinomonadaceae bacterium]
GNSLECGNLLPLWSSATCRCCPMVTRPVRFYELRIPHDGCDRSQTAKALTGQRTPNKTKR